MIKRIECAVSGNAGVVPNVDARGPAIQGHMMVETDPLTQADRAMDNTICSDLAAICHDNVATRLRKKDCLGRHKAGLPETHGLQCHQLLLDLPLPGFRPGTMFCFQATVEPGHIGQAFFVLFAVVGVSHGTLDISVGAALEPRICLRMPRKYDSRLKRRSYNKQYAFSSQPGMQ